MLMPPLINKWNVLKDEDKDLFPLLEVTLDLYHLAPVDLVLLSCIVKLDNNE